MKVERETVFMEYGPSTRGGYDNRVTGCPVQMPEATPSTECGLSILHEMLREVADAQVPTGRRLRITVEVLDEE